MGLDVYNMVKEVIGELPLELQFIYAICTILVFMIVLLMVYGVWNIVFGKK